MANTTNFGWETPDDTDLVKDGAAAMRTLGSAIDTSMADLKGGTTGQVLAKNSNTDMDFIWTADASGIPATIFDAKGDIIAASAADTAARLAVGTNGQVLTADSTAATGLAWTTIATGPTFVGCSVYSNNAQSISNSINTIALYAAELFDTNGFHSTTTNTSRITIPSGKAGKYLLTASVAWTGGTAAGLRQWLFYKNGSEIGMVNRQIIPSGTTDVWQPGSMIVDAAVGDYFEINVLQTGGTTCSLDSGSTRHFFQAIYLGA